MLRLSLALLFLSTAALAQPWGPYEIAATSDSTQCLLKAQIAIIDSQTARIFYTFDVPGQSEVRTVLYDLQSHQVIGTPVLVRSDSVSQDLLDAAVDGADAWVVIYSRRFNATWVDTKFVIGHEANRRDGFIGTTGYPDSPYVPNYYLSDFDLTSRIGGGWTLTWVQVISPPPWYEDGSQIYVAGLNPDSMVYRQPLLSMRNQFFGPENAAAVSLSPDCSLVLTRGIWDPNGFPPTMMLRAIAGADSEILDTVCTFDCDLNVHRLNRASDGSLLAYSEANALSRINEMRGCEALGSLSNNYPPTDMGFRSGYGYASIWTTPGSILLGRLHEDGTAMQPGLFYQPDAGYAIRDASVDIAPDGRIYIVWSEGSSIQTRMMISRIGWDTPLGVKNSDFIPHPSSFILSCFPNPFNSTLEIRFDVPRSQKVELAVYNLLGQKVTTLFTGMKPAGSYRQVWSPSGAVGLFFVRMRTADAVKTAKVLYLR